MFDRSENLTLAMPERIDIHHHRAPTDDSVKLLREMESKARQQVLESYVFEGNEVRGSAVLILDPAEFRKMVVLRFELNGKVYQTERVIAPSEFGVLKDRMHWYREFAAKVAEAVTHTLLLPALQETLDPRY